MNASKPAVALAVMGTGVLGGLGSALLASSRPVLVLGAAVGLLAAGALVLYPAVAFLATCFVIPIERLGRFTQDSSMVTISLMRIVGVTALAGFLLHAMLKRVPIRFGTPFVLYAAYLAIAFTGVFFSSDPQTTVRAFGAALGNLLFFFLVINMARDWTTIRRAVLVWLVSTVVMGLFTIYNWHFGASVSEDTLGSTETRFSVVLDDNSEYESLNIVARATGPTSHSAVYGINLIMTVPFFLYFLRGARTRGGRALAAGGLAITGYNILLTNTRAALILFVIVLALCVVRGGVRLTANNLVALVLAGFAMLPFVPDAVYERVFDPSNYTVDKSSTLRSRLDFWQAGLQVAEKEWVTGVGIGNQAVVPKYLKGIAPEATTVHNTYLMTFIEVGIVGFLLFYAFVAHVTAAAFRVGRKLRRDPQETDRYRFFVAAQIAMVAVLIYGLQVDVFLFPLKGWWLVAGLSWSMYLLLAETRDSRTTRASS